MYQQMDDVKLPVYRITFHKKLTLSEKFYYFFHRRSIDDFIKHINEITSFVVDLTDRKVYTYNNKRYVIHFNNPMNWHDLFAFNTNNAKNIIDIIRNAFINNIEFKSDSYKLMEERHQKEFEKILAY